MTGEASKIRAAFIEAGTRLGIAIGTPPIDGLGELSEHLACHVVHFGGLKGCLPVSLTAPPSVIAAIHNAGFYCSQLAESFERFEAPLFQDALNDWGYFGPPTQCPSWYAGYILPAQA